MTGTRFTIPFVMTSSNVAALFLIDIGRSLMYMPRTLIIL